MRAGDQAEADGRERRSDGELNSAGSGTDATTDQKVNGSGFDLTSLAEREM
jgi:hypothetical protein